MGCGPPDEGGTRRDCGCGGASAARAVADASMRGEIEYPVVNRGAPSDFDDGVLLRAGTPGPRRGKRRRIRLAHDGIFEPTAIASVRRDISGSFRLER